MALKLKKNYNDTISAWHVDIAGEVDIHTSGNLKDVLNTILNDREADIQLNCEDLVYIDSTGLGVLIGILKRVKKNDNNIIIVNAKSNIAKLLNITGLDKIFVIGQNS
ncbi:MULTISPECIES: STAS domain-containing protein [unclassified Fusibacter]|uniref:STAS domain-containing protein n=1 Tax=unclassified Fusibacter TaxID=2624464 RepID=UPI001012062E|nr:MULTISPECIES: STAS domain-containing protein [unclassified Fusibacter]MCK8060841.1 STAS domain-containing protein [Fusibacter sp. A2]NPE23137.1 STAS domain-containing protein [Fusibacter sp. A1]RXV59495.1 anti-sigma factor antagonist [Fusibacter sp. A1]